ncbi:MAG: hypothetical protein H7144_10525 [Burkholderiales bacterium]|nr:hypothetical protein [Phycisphaerae bacterium]
MDQLEPRQLFAVLTPGQTVTTTISVIGQQKNWTVPLVAGRAVTVAAGDLGTGSFATQLSLINPSGAVVATNSGNAGAFVTTTALVTGTYTVRLSDVGNNQTGSARVTAFYYASSITDSDDAFAAESGRRRAATIQPGDLDVWTLSASQAQFLSTVATENRSGDVLGIGVQLIGPHGKIVQQKSSDKGVKIDVSNSAAGKYYAVVYEPGSNATGRYGISFARAPGTQYAGDPDTATPLPANTTRYGDLPGGDIDIFAITIAAGKKLSATVARTTGLLSPELLLIDPTGKVVATVNGSTTATLNYTAVSAGKYWLVARDREADNGGQFSIKYTLS